MDEKLRDTANLGVEIMNRKQHEKGKLGHVVQIRVCRLTFDVNVMLNLSNKGFLKSDTRFPKRNKKKTDLLNLTQ